ncbi:MAG: TerB family tellurite resistance protein [Leptospirales bacterium]
MAFAKWIGGGLGWALGGPIGAIIGYVFGSAVDNRSMSGQSGASGATTRSGDFAASLLILSAAVIRADHKVEKSELDYVRGFFTRQFGATLAQQYMKALENILNRHFSTSEVCEQIRVNMDYASRVQLLHYLFGIAKADNHVAKEEVAVIYTIGIDLGVSPEDIHSVQAMFYKDTASAYTVLEVTPEANDEEIKTAYRKMAIKFHPDKVTHLGEEFQQDAKEKFQKVNGAYEKIKKERGFS